jgi:DNA invertase Pin-like site-specific DNA recombinase
VERAAILAEAERRGWRVVEADAGYGAKGLNWPGNRAAFDLAKRRPDRTLMVSRVGRLSMSMLDLASITQKATHEGWALVGLELGVGPATPRGNMMAHVLVAFAQFERRLISEKTKDALRVRKAQGVRLGRDRAIPPEVAVWIRRDRGRGQTFQEIADSLNRAAIPTARGGQRWYPSTISAVLRQDPDYREERRGG